VKNYFKLKLLLIIHYSFESFVKLKIKLAHLVLTFFEHTFATNIQQSETSIEMFKNSHGKICDKNFGIFWKVSNIQFRMQIQVC